MLSFVVLGTPVPQGSMRAFMPKGGRFPIVTSDNPKLRPWRATVAAAAREAFGERPPIVGAVDVACVFFLPRPDSLPKSVTEPVKTRGSDIDKLERSLLDALSEAGVWQDDAQCVSVVKRKAFAGGLRDPKGPAGVPRLEVVVREARVVVLQPSLFEAEAAR